MKNGKHRTGILANLAVLAVGAFLWTALASPVSVAAMAGKGRGVVYRGAREDCVSLQILVEWDAASLPDIAETLKEYGASATFVLTGEWAAAHPELVRSLAKYGNGFAVFAENAAGDSETIAALTGIEPELCIVRGEERAPAGFTPVACTFDLDCGRGSAEELAERLRGHISKGCIISACPTAAFSEALPEILKIIKNMGLDIVPTHKMLYNKFGMV